MRTNLDRKPKANAITDAVRLRIVHFGQKNPHLSMREISLEKGYTYQQVREAFRKYKAGELGSSRVDQKRNAKKKIENKVTDLSTPELLKEMLRDVTIEIQASDKMSTIEKVDLIQKVAGSVDKMQKASLMLNIKNPDIQVIAAMCRDLEPSLSDQQILELYNRNKDLGRIKS